MVTRRALAQRIRLEVDELNHLVDGLSSIWQKVRLELRNFADFLDQLEDHE